MFCAISGTSPIAPVVTARGVVYEKALIVKAIEVRAGVGDDSTTRTRTRTRTTGDEDDRADRAEPGE